MGTDESKIGTDESNQTVALKTRWDRTDRNPTHNIHSWRMTDPSCHRQHDPLLLSTYLELLYLSVFVSTINLELHRRLFQSHWNLEVIIFGEGPCKDVNSQILASCINWCCHPIVWSDDVTVWLICPKFWLICPNFVTVWLICPNIGSDRPNIGTD